jgi:signal transduction histidine kinase/ligand-binding sensor domain-containing protein/DNA-binding response OmpR family regulator
MSCKLHIVILLTVALFLNAAPVISLNNTKFVLVHQLTTNDGLSNNEIINIVQDNTGYIWIGTQNGLNRFNGYEFDVYNTGSENSLPANQVRSLYADSENNIWIGSEGLTLYKPEKGYFTNWYFRPGDPVSVDDNYINSITGDHLSRVWIATHSGIRIVNHENELLSSLNYNETLKVNTATIEKFLKSGVPGHVISRAAALLEMSFPDEYNMMEALITDECDEISINFYHELIGEAIREWDNTSLRSDQVVNLTKDSIGLIWITYGHDGISCIDPATMDIKHYPDVVDVSGVAVNLINSITVSKNKVYIATSTQGLKLLDIETGITEQVELDGEPYLQHLRMEDGNLWISDNRGLLVYNIETGIFQRKGLFIPNQGAMNEFIGKFTFRDNQDNLWIGTSYTGLFMALHQDNFKTFRINTLPPTGNPINAVSSIAIDSKGNYWVGHVKGNVEVYGSDKKLLRVLDRPGFQKSMTTDVFSIKPDHENNIWIGSFAGGAEKYSENGNPSTCLRHDVSNNRSMPGNDVRDIAVDQDGNVYFAIHGKGVVMYAQKTGQLSMIECHQENERSIWTLSLLVDDNYLWVGSVGGLTRYCTDTGETRNYLFEEYPVSLITIRSILKDSGGLLWLGTDHGVLVLDPDAGEYFRLTTAHGLSDSKTASIIEDNSGNIWISTKKGLTRIEMSYKIGKLLSFLKSSDQEDIKPLVSVFTIADGLISDVFNVNASAKSDGGHIYFGSISGIIYFHPDSLEANIHVPPVIISSLSLFNKEVKPNDRTGILKNDIIKTGKIVLKYSQRVISMEFTALNFTYPEKNMYAYKMEGFDDDWIYTGHRRTATYTNLNPGTYLFRVKAANNNGVWNEEGTTLEILVKHPFYRTRVAYLFYLVLITGLVYLLRLVMHIKTHARMEVRKAKEIDEIKTSFFTNISHEFRTPLTLIEGPVEKLVKEKEKFDWNKDYYQVNLIYRNVQRLKLLISELMEFRKVAEGRQQLKVMEGDLGNLVNEIGDAFHCLADDKNISFSIDVPKEPVMTWFDPKIIEKSLFNLLYNAFKFTPPGGNVKLQLKIKKHSDEVISEYYAGEYIRLEVTDTGPGIPDEVREKIFEKFYQADNQARKEEGSGIGLALVKELVTLHKGDVSFYPAAKDKSTSGAAFVIKIPYGKEYYQGNLVDQIFDGPDKLSLIKKTTAMVSLKKPSDNNGIPDSSKYTLLIVEDDEDISCYLKDELHTIYNIVTATSAEAGFSIAGEEIPDLILSDIMLPGMNGLEFCKLIKADLKTEHIPVILLTARAEDGDKLRGLETGADDFVIKPFVLEELKLRIRNCIQTRIILRKRFINDFISTPLKNKEYNSSDRFISKALQIVNDNISNPELDVNFLTSEIGMSRAQLYRKFNAMTNQSVKQFVRTVRLKKAAEMLNSGNCNVSEAAYAVGFNDLSYFTRSFKSQYGITPSEYVRVNADDPQKNPML